MTREQAYKKFKKIDSNIKWVDFNLGYMKLLDEIYDDFERELLKAQKKSYIDGSNNCHSAILSNINVDNVWTWKKKVNK